MFLHLPDKDAIELREDGEFVCKPAKLPHNYPSDAPGVYHRVTYKRKHPASIPTLIFDCLVIEYQESLYIKDLELSNQCAHMPEGMQYFFLDWFIKKAANTAPLNGKKRLTVSSAVPHITEIFVDNGFERISRLKASFEGTKDCLQGLDL